MRYFTRAFASGDLSDDETASVSAAYDNRIAEIASTLTPDLAWLASGPLHDAIFENAIWSAGTRYLRLALVAGDNARGYQSVEIAYEDVSIGDRQVAALSDVVRDREAEVLHTEVDLEEDGTFVHRYLFWPREEVTIGFTSAQVTREARADRRVEFAGSLIVEE